jgi:hypothetical protein
VRREYSELFDKNGNLLKDARSPTLFSVFLDSSKIMAGSEVAFSIEVAVSTAGYEVDGALFLKQHIPGEYLFRDTLALFAKRDGDEWKLRYAWTNENWATGRKDPADLVRIGQKANGIPQKSVSGFIVPLQSGKGFSAELNIALSPWA